MPSLLNQAPPWNGSLSEYLTLWHGCTDRDRLAIEENGIDLAFSRTNLDFGRGFYTTTLRRQAEHWAVRRFDYRDTIKEDNGPVVLKFTLSRGELAKMSWLGFVLASYENDDFWSLVQHCRQSKGEMINDHRGPVAEAGHNWFDIVMGPVVAGWQQRSAMADMDQVSFHTTQSINLLNELIASNDLEKYSWHTL